MYINNLVFYLYISNLAECQAKIWHTNVDVTCIYGEVEFSIYTQSKMSYSIVGMIKIRDDVDFLYSLKTWFKNVTTSPLPYVHSFVLRIKNNIFTFYSKLGFATIQGLPRRISLKVSFFLKMQFQLGTNGWTSIGSLTKMGERLIVHTMMKPTQ
jgi:hypothetical protein